MSKNTLPKHSSGGIQTAVFLLVRQLEHLLKGGQKLNPGNHIGDGQQARHHGGDKPPVGDLHAAAEPTVVAVRVKFMERSFVLIFFVVEKILTKRPFFFIKIRI